MAVVSVTRKFSGRRSRYDEGGGETIVEPWSVLLDGSDEQSLAARIARRADGIPRVGQQAEFDPFMRAKSVEAVPVGGSPVLWDVLVTWGPPKGFSGSSSESEEPLISPFDERPQIQWGTERTEEPIDQDANGNPLVNVVGESFDPPISRNFSDEVLSVTKNQAAFSSTQAVQFVDTVNADTFMGHAAGTGYMDEISAVEIEEGGFIYYRVTYKMRFRKDGWRKRVLHRGFREWVESTPDGPVYKNFTDEDGNPVAEPLLLDETGGALPKYQPAQWLEFEVYSSSTWGDLNIL